MTLAAELKSRTWLIDDMVAGTWIHPETGKPARVPYESVIIADSLDGAEGDLVAGVGLRGRLAVVCDQNTRDILGGRVASGLRRLGMIETIVIDHPHADEAEVERLKEKTRHADALIAVGSGTINDLCKYVTAQDGRGCAVFATAPSMNGYTSTTASITLPNGLKVSKAAQAPKGVFVDLAINAAAPRHLIAAGFGDCIVRSVAQIDWWLSKRLLDTYYSDLPFLIQADDETELMARAPDLAKSDFEAVAYLHRVLTLCGFGTSFTGMTNHGSMGEHQISHYIDCFAGSKHPGTLHGQQVGVATLTMARLQAQFLESDTPPVVKATQIDEAAMRKRYPAGVADMCLAELNAKALDARGAEAMNAKLAAMWPELRRELQAFQVPAETLRTALAASGGATTAEQLGLDVPFYRQALLNAREIRRRFSVLDLMADAGKLEAFVAGES
jgi:glycerol-1-phosphate dehydrogenase [NAD(P)+]